MWLDVEVECTVFAFDRLICLCVYGIEESMFFERCCGVWGVGSIVCEDDEKIVAFPVCD